MKNTNVLKFSPINKDLRITTLEFYNNLDALTKDTFNRVDRRTGANLRASLIAVMLLKYTAHWFNRLSEIELEEENQSKDEPFDHSFKLQFDQVRLLATDLLDSFMSKDYNDQKAEIEELATEFMKDFKSSKLYSAIQRKEKANLEAVDKLNRIMEDTMKDFRDQVEQPIL